MDTVAAIRLALSAAASMQADKRLLDCRAQADIEKAVLYLDDFDIARSERDNELRKAFRECRGSFPRFLIACQLFITSKWPSWRYLAAAPADASPRERALFNASRCALALSPDGCAELPGVRRLRDIVQSTPSDCIAAPASCADLLTKGSQ